jgi:hypothetical protein
MSKSLVNTTLLKDTSTLAEMTENTDQTVQADPMDHIENMLRSRILTKPSEADSGVSSDEKDEKDEKVEINEVQYESQYRRHLTSCNEKLTTTAIVVTKYVVIYVPVICVFTKHLVIKLYHVCDHVLKSIQSTYCPNNKA